MRPQGPGDARMEERLGCGPLIAPLTEQTRPLRQQVFERVRAAGLIARVQVAKDLGVSPASVTTITQELIEVGLIEEVSAQREGDQGRGRPAVALGVRASAHLVAGMKLSDREHTAVIVDFAGNLIADAVIARRPGAMTLPELLSAMETLLAQVCQKAGLDLHDLKAVGLGVPGFVDCEQGMVLWSSVLLDRGVALGHAASMRFGVPVHVDNDANLVTLAELWFGAGRALSDFAVVTIEHGVGMGFVFNHRIYRGAKGLGMELGHTKVQLDGALCRCGQRGCLEAYVADYALAREATTALNWSHKDGQSINVLLESLYDHAKAGNTAARSIFRRAGRYLAVGLSNVVNLFDPSLIILSGERMRYDYLYAAETLAEMEHLAISTGRPKPPIEIHAWGDLLWAHGAAALALSMVTERLLTAPREIAAQ
ncbi:Sugar kinase of the NBD/HSP70 family, may contain an N-terminal HTH domain [Gemmobacter aquatilis]|uniref:Sugar kinase of the NBD/HSP70 family, may contain an N-terminal HTH domain n=1 Tax=Gemmobacter aquatilis TaxID=933059 RepID=A0A1H7YPY0_9RHOB|nr:ROK family protein [Gemmobacter aquatilis]SEM47249.1 Sugar kinase of the NBD/HSP70 family, may contain an N-terminal HTH domain [Gemmobacter aquatilis]